MQMQQCNVSLPPHWVARLVHASHETSLQRGDNVRYTDLIREAIAEKYGLPPDEARPGATPAATNREANGEKSHD